MMNLFVLCVIARRASTVGLRYAVTLSDVAQSTNTEGTRELVRHFENKLAGYSPQLFEKGWAKRAAYGKIYGAKYISRYRDEIDQMFLKGCEDQRNKMGPRRMLEALRSNYPNRFDLPSETEIRQRA